MKVWLTLCSLLVAGAIFALGFIAGSGTQPKRPGPGGFPFPSSPDPFDNWITNKEILDDLGLEEGQREKIAALVEEKQQKTRELRDGMRNLGTQLQSELNNILTETQKKRLEQLQNEYAEKEIKSKVARDLSKLRINLDLTAEQEPRIHDLLLGAENERRELWKKCQGSDEINRGDFFKASRAISDAKDAKVLEILSAPQGEKYRKMRAEERPPWDDRRRRHDKDKDKSPAIPAGKTP